MKNYISIVLLSISIGAFCQQPPHADFSVSDSVVCKGGCIDFTNLSSNNATAWSWYSDCDECDYEYKNVHFCYDDAGVHNVRLTEVNAYGRDSVEKQIRVLPGPDKPILVNDGDSVINETVYPAGFKYQWYQGDEALKGDTFFFIIISQADIYKQYVTDKSTGCTVVGSINLTVTGIETTLNNAVDFAVYPNPVSKEDIQLTVGNDWLGGKAMLYDMHGSLVYQSAINDQQTFIPVTSISPGIYVLRMVTNEKMVMRKIVKE